MGIDAPIMIGSCWAIANGAAAAMNKAKISRRVLYMKPRNLCCGIKKPKQIMLNGPKNIF